MGEKRYNQEGELREEEQSDGRLGIFGILKR